MKFIAIVYLTFFIFINHSKIDNSNLVCADFKSGKFQIINKKTNKKYLILRSKDVQIEKVFDLVTNKPITKEKYYRILWKNDCQYTLLLNLTKSGHDKIDLYINSKGGYVCTIKKIENKCAVIETEFEGEILRSQICKLN